MDGIHAIPITCFQHRLVILQGDIFGYAVEGTKTVITSWRYLLYEPLDLPLHLLESALLANILIAFVQEAPQRFQPTFALKDARTMQWLCPALQSAASADWKVMVSDLAHTVACSPTQLRRLFQQAFGVSPRQWLLEQRLQCAAYLLQVSEKSIQQIADACGFDSLSHSTRYFRRKFGYLPAQYRKSLWQESAAGSAMSVTP